MTKTKINQESKGLDAPLVRQRYFKNCGGCGKLVEKERWILKTEQNIKDHYRPNCKDCAIWAELPVY